jgi:hypothetical protein
LFCLGKIEANDFENILIADSGSIKNAICLIKIVLRCLYIKDGNIFMLYQLKIKNGLNHKLTLKYNPEPERTITYRFGKNIQKIHKLGYFIEANIFMKIY